MVEVASSFLEGKELQSMNHWCIYLYISHSMSIRIIQKKIHFRKEFNGFDCFYENCKIILSFGVQLGITNIFILRTRYATFD